MTREIFTYSDNSKYFTGQYYSGANALGPVSYEWLGGNIVKETYEDGYSLIEYGDELNPFHDVIYFDLGFDSEFLGTFSQNNPVKITYFPDGEAAEITKIDYNYNFLGYPTGYSVTSPDLVIRAHFLEYKCK